MREQRTSSGSFDIDITQEALRFNELLNTIEPGQNLQIVAGQAVWQFYSLVEAGIRQAHQEKQTTINIVAGPVLSVDDNYDSALLRLARGPEPIATLYIADFRPLRHYRIIGDQVLQVEERHSPWQSGRQIDEYRDKHSIFIHIHDFNNFILAYGHQWSEGGPHQFIKLTDINRRRINPAFEYDFLPADQVRQRIGEMITT